MGYYYWCPYYPGCGIIPMIDRIKRKFFGHSVNKRRVYRHYASEITCSELITYKLIIITCLVYNKIIHNKVKLGILLLVILLIILFKE